jgi:hypothetical protein
MNAEIVYRPRRLRQWAAGLLSAGAEQLRRDFDSSPPYVVEVKNEWSCTPAPLFAFVAWRGATLHFYEDYEHCLLRCENM